MFNEKTLQYLATTYNVPQENITNLVEDLTERLNKNDMTKVFADYSGSISNMKERISFFNTILYNTYRKFPYEVRLQAQELFPPLKLENLTGVVVDGKEYSMSGFTESRPTITYRSSFIFTQPASKAGYENKPEKRYIPASLLWFDPIACAQQARKNIRAAQKRVIKAENEKLAKDLQVAKVNLTKSKNELERLEAQEKKKIEQVEAKERKRLERLKQANKVS